MKQLLVGLLLLIGLFPLAAASPSPGLVREIDSLRLYAQQKLTANPGLSFYVSGIYEQINQKIIALPPGTYPLDARHHFYHKEALPLIDQHLPLIETKEERQFFLQSERPMLEGALSTCYEFYQKTGDTRYLDKAFHIIEKQKFPSRQLSGMLPKDLNTALRKLEGQLLALQDSIRQKDQLDLRKRKNQLRQELSDLNDQIRAGHPEYVAFLELQQMVQLRDFQNALHSIEVVLEYFVGHQAIYAFVIKADTAALIPIPISHSLVFPETVERYLTGLKHPGLYREMVPAAHRLYQLLLQPLEAHLQNSTKITIIPDPLLQAIPFEALLKTLPEKLNYDYAKLDYLIHHYPFAYHRSATQMAIHAQGAALQKDAPKVVAFAPGFDQRLHQHFKDRREYWDDPDYLALDSLSHLTQNLQLLHSEFQATTYKWHQATISNFKEHLQDDILHLGTHLHFDPEYLMQSRIVLAKEQNASDQLTSGYLTLQDLHSFPMMDIDLAVLAACASGKDGFGFAYGFESAGISSTLYSLWKINEKESARIIQAFYQHLRNGQPKDKALHLAKTDYLKVAKDLRMAPKYWAAFILNGDTQPFAFDPPGGKNKYPMAASIACILLLLLFLYRWKRPRPLVE